jgi:hypothetical protein
MLTTVLKAVKMLLSCCPKNSQDVAVLPALKAVQDAEENHPHRNQVQRFIPIILPLSLVRRLVGNLDHPGLEAELQKADPPKRLGEQVCNVNPSGQPAQGGVARTPSVPRERSRDSTAEEVDATQY